MRGDAGLHRSRPDRLVYLDRWRARRPQRIRAEGPGAASASAVRVAAGDLTRHRALQLSLLIATGIGLHNFGEGLAIGNSAATGQISLAVLLVIGFGAHNATEGFAIVAPLAGAEVHLSWTRMTILGLIGGGPTFLGTLVGEQVTSPVPGVAFLSLAAGSILYVVIQLLAVARAAKLKEIVTRGILLGLTLGFITDAVVTASGA